MYVGYMGDIPFIASDKYLLTPSETSRAISSRWADHELIGQKPVSQFVGANLEELSFKITLSAEHGVNPKLQIEKLKNLVDTGTVFPVILGDSPISENYWRLESFSVDDSYYTATGHLMQTEVSVKLKEYDDSNYHEQSKLETYGRIFNVATILGGG